MSAPTHASRPNASKEPQDARTTQNFRRYLESSGAMNALAAALVSLHDSERPANAIPLLLDSIGSQEGDSPAASPRHRAPCSGCEAHEREAAQLRERLAELEARLARLESPPPPLVAPGATLLRSSSDLGAGAGIVAPPTGSVGYIASPDRFQ
ncbi:hypothetical protein H696_00808 [Fonticula alba]|uniref:c-Myc-binding protein n=1 Tax=Fonticula alba TaxID=691883 RepID=A0A058ZH24_FONAL|nr:hypothetical protein H696_00808 [Fonticula alba]KCV73266.1 hypothetical protein H696_00808 [Fonticula alba]|eukprot:XP_009492967.1 hypothetical protein H696_00808 [Fonticula alba]